MIEHERVIKANVSRIGFNATDNMGVKLENIVFIELKRRGYDVFLSGR